MKLQQDSDILSNVPRDNLVDLDIVRFLLVFTCRFNTKSEGYKSAGLCFLF